MMIAQSCSGCKEAGNPEVAGLGAVGVLLLLDEGQGGRGTAVAVVGYDSMGRSGCEGAGLSGGQSSGGGTADPGI